MERFLDQARRNIQVATDHSERGERERRGYCFDIRCHRESSFLKEFLTYKMSIILKNYKKSEMNKILEYNKCLPKGSQHSTQAQPLQQVSASRRLINNFINVRIGLFWS